jgi:hypothetical protein
VGADVPGVGDLRRIAAKRSRAAAWTRSIRASGWPRSRITAALRVAARSKLRRRLARLRTK